MNPETLKHAPRGYVSEESKRKFTLTAGILGAVFFFGQMIVPFVLVMVFMPAIFVGGFFTLEQADLERAAAWDGRLWYVTHGIGGPAGTSRPSTRLWSLATGPEARPREVATLEGELPWLLDGGDRLWVISPDGVRFLKGDALSEPLRTESVNAHSRPFLHRGMPALVGRDPDGDFLAVFTPGGWRREADLDLGAGREEAALCDIQVLGSGDSVHVFRRVEDQIYHRPGFPKKEQEGGWKPVASAGRQWVATLSGDGPAIFHTGGVREFGQTVTGLRLRDGLWEPFLSHRVPMTSGFGVASPGPDRFWLMLQGFPGSLRVADVDRGKVSSERKFGSGFPFGGFLVGFVAITQFGSLAAPLLLAVLLSALMARHRVCEYGAGDQKVPFASLTRRAFAQLLDSAIEMGPAALGGLLMVARFEDMTSPFDLFKGFGLLALGGLWVLASFFLFSYTEGAWGWTPGKWLLGIRVMGADLRPCGFGRALVRNLLKFADGFMNFLVGILVSALSENWQRVGDMAARTVVVRATPREPVSLTSRGS